LSDDQISDETVFVNSKLQ